MYALFRDAAESIRPGWTWGPAMGVTNAALADRFGKVQHGGHTLLEAVEAARKATVGEMKNRGMKVTKR
jgi:multiple sugar transport system substrate-binding protein